MRSLLRSSLYLFFFVLATFQGWSQRQYAAHSVLSTGNWYKISTSSPGVYKVDAALLSRVGITLPLNSAQIRLFGNGGQMLAEDNALPRPDDLIENSIWMEDGGDGSFSGNDYFLFYAPGPDLWEFNQQAGRYQFSKNLYSDSSWYFITIGGQGKRIASVSNPAAPATVNEFDEHYANEKNDVNFLSSGKEWYGEEFNSRVPARDFDIPLKNAVPGKPIIIYTDAIGRAAGQNSRFEVKLNGNLVQQILMPPLPGVAYEPVATPGTATTTTTVNQADLRLTYTFFPGSVNGQGWLNKFELGFRRKLDMAGQAQLLFRDRASVGVLPSARYVVDAAPNGSRVWDITNPFNPVDHQVTRSGTALQFSNDCSILREYISFSPDRYPVPVATGRIPNQDLHGSPGVPYLIVTHPALRAEAEKIGQFHKQQQGLNYMVAETIQIYNEFASGSADPAAIRDFVKMFYDRAGADSTRRPKYLLLLGDASYDYKNRIESNTNLVPAFQSSFSLDPLTTYTSDDFFGFLDDNENINSVTTVNSLDIGIGRVPATTAADARAYADKLGAYVKSFGPWRTQATFVGDDEDQNLHLQDAELISATARSTDPEINMAKLYLDAFPQESGAGGSRYPQVNEAINRRIFTGNLIWNYSGHGGNRRLAQEAVLEEDMVNTWTNENKLPLFITATCDFAPYDNPQVRSIGENILLRPRTGGIAMMTTTRLVFAFSNRIMNNNYIATALARNADGSYLSLGEAVKRAKNYTYQTTSDILNNRKFTLLGDPALTLGYPRYQVATTAINGIPVGAYTDTIRALNRYTMSGEVRDQNGNLIGDFNGTVYPSFYDKVQQQTTRGNDPGSIKTGFEQQQNLIYNGKAKVQNGRFSFTFIVPKDMDLRTGRTRLSYYADNGIIDASGAETGFYAGGLGNEVKDDGQGPTIKAYMNDEKFVNGGLVNETPVLILKLKDSSGLNTVGTGIGHDIVAILDDNTDKIFVLNDFYEAESGSYQEGTVRFPMAKLEEGQHSLKIRVWDVFNNATEYILEFKVVKKEALELKHVLNYPNPFTSRTSFWFEHNRPGEDLQVTIRVMTITGKVVKTIAKTINTPGNRSDEIEWNGRDDYGAQVGRGVYLYQVIVKTKDGRQQHKLEKLVIL
ncbi:MAG TPA: type IX secretion system sortase PorU [Chitinophagaceae bacterium]|nr:type IX secretion system sortase PorU [Chitinophagaceae bacterium]